MNKAKLTELVASMSTDEIVEKMFTNPTSRLPNRAAFDLSYTGTTVAVIDVDSLKWVNDNMGHVAGDRMLRVVGEALRTEFGDDAFHLSGDEFAVLTSDIQSTLNRLVWLQEQMLNRTITEIVSGGHYVEYRGAGAFSFGVGRTLKEADARMMTNKQYRENMGRRAKRGEAPEGISFNRDYKALTNA